MNKESASADRGEMIKQRRKTRFKKNIEQGFVKLVLFILLLGFAYVILYPFLFKITAAFMMRSPEASATFSPHRPPPLFLPT